MASSLEQLERDYCPPLDPSLIRAIVSDFDNLEDTSIQQIRQQLDLLKQDTNLEEAWALENFADLQIARDLERLHGSKSSATDGDAVSPSLSSIDREGGSSLGPDAEDSAVFEMAAGQGRHDVGGNIQTLKEMFPSMKEFTITHRFKKCENNFGRTVEELLNQVFFEADEVTVADRYKGIDGFAAPTDTPGAKKVRGKKNHRRSDLRSQVQAKSSSTMIDSEPEVNQWRTKSEDVKFVTSRTSLSEQAVSSAYHKSGYSLPSTIDALLLEHGKSQSSIEDLSDLDPLVQVNLMELRERFPSLPTEHLVTIIRLTESSSSAAHDLAEVLTSPRKSTASSTVEIVTRLPPIYLHSHNDVPHSSVRSRTQRSLQEAVILSTEARSAQQTASTQAQAAYRKGKSDHLMGAAAGYYSSLAREHGAKARGYDSAAADALVEAQSNRREIDLHGVNVKDAVRISQERVRTWWVNMGDARVGDKAGAGRTFRIVTGVGRHSEGGKGRIGPAVAKMLIREGYKVEASEGVLTVTGVTGRPR